METADLTRQRELLRERGICAVIPTYNNGGTIARVVAGTLEQCRDVIVVNDGSTDTTAQTLASMATEGLTVITLNQNSGKGAALKAGFRKALEMGFAYAITLDGDGQHYPEDIATMLHANQEHPGALILGSRMLDGTEQSKGSRFANKFSNFWLWVQTGLRLDDTQTGYRLYPIRKLRGLSLLTARYEAELELVVLASWHGTEIQTVPIRVYYPPKEERVSHFRPGKDFARISLLNTVLCVLAVIYGLPLRLWRWIMKYVRTLYALLFFSFIMFVIINPAVWIYLKIGRMTERKRRNLHQLIYKASRFIMLKHGIPGTKFTYNISDGVTFDRPRIIICNHQSHLDLMCQLILSPNLVFLTNDWVWHNPFYGLLIRNAEFYPVREGLEELMPKLQSLVERGYSIAVYPEGTRSKDCRIGRFHKGAFYLSEQLGVEMLPMCLYGPGKVLPKKSYTLRKSPIYIEVGQPITRQELEAMGDNRQQASTLRKLMTRKYESICNEIEQHV